MISASDVVIGKIACVIGGQEGLLSMAKRAVESFANDRAEIGGVIVATFSNSERFPALSVRLAAHLGLPIETPAFDLQMACSAYPYAVYLAGKLSCDTGRKIVVVDGDAQLRLVNRGDHATKDVFSDAVSASLVWADANGTESRWAFMSKCDEALLCDSDGPIRMDGFKVFSFVATDVNRFLRGFLGECGEKPAFFAPHQANPYMIRQLARSLHLERELLTLNEQLRNPGSCSVAMTLASAGSSLAGRRGLIAGFGAGLSASAGIIRIDDDFIGKVV